MFCYLLIRGLFFLFTQVADDISLRIPWDIPPVAMRIRCAIISLGSSFTRKTTSVIRKNGPALLSCGTYVSGSDPTRVARKALALLPSPGATAAGAAMLVTATFVGTGVSLST